VLECPRLHHSSFEGRIRQGGRKLMECLEVHVGGCRMRRERKFPTFEEMGGLAHLRFQAG